MAYGLEEMTGILPTVVVAGVAMKMTEKLFPSPGSNCATPGRRIRSKGRGRGLTRGRGRGPIGQPRSSVGFGNFSNLGF